MAVTRELIADVVADAFTMSPVSRGELIEAATTAGADSGVLRTLQGLPEIEYRHLRDLWPHLPEVPVQI